MSAHGRFRPLRLRGPRSLRSQLLAASLLILSGLLLLIGVLQYVIMRNFIYSNRAETMQTQIRSIPREVIFNLARDDADGTLPGDSPEGQPSAQPPPPFQSEAGDSGRVWNGARRPLLLDAQTTIAIYTPDGTFTDLQRATLAESEAPRLSDAEYRELLDDADSRHPNRYRIISSGGGSEQLAVFQRFGRSDGPEALLQMSVDTGPLRKVILTQLLIFVGLSAAALLAGLFLYVPALRRTLVPLSTMRTTAQRIDAGNLDLRFPSRQGQEEIDQLSHSFNGMLERLEGSFRSEREAKERMRRFAADASHELRTPLTSIHGFLEVLLRGAADNKEQLDKALRSMHGESRRINKLVEDLLLLARMDGEPGLRTRELELGGVLAEMEPQLRMLADGRRVDFALEEDLWGRYDPDKIKQVVLNLFQNAVQHTDPAAGCIRVALKPEGSWAVLTVQDNGPGIPPEHLPYVFDRFYRSDASRARKYGGSGLGLSITKSITEAHGGEITADSPPGQGARFRVLLPRTEAPN
ncbi:HAMP domain-containing histidine kinase [Paenibacillus spiritus]|uniref:histidine kinase n=1 Tax=Paenibacillus spiritus TaxID=2496557 RepID=A0A5J5FUX4_9BACL|nr:HAMP domain-containing sensor histidine kinase [Paenibacillus spiritus]KAA8997177.1 HAMP domain-containing histidine kinase [Paenibacillus spiritus]